MSSVEATFLRNKPMAGKVIKMSKGRSLEENGSYWVTLSLIDRRLSFNPETNLPHQRSHAISIAFHPEIRADTCRFEVRQRIPTVDRPQGRSSRGEREAWEHSSYTNTELPCTVKITFYLNLKWALKPLLRAALRSLDVGSSL